MSGTATPEIRYRPDIDGLRAVAVLSVLVFHAFPDALPGGFVGVDVFFVISGYLITGILLSSMRRGTFSLANFYVRRVRRIFPALVVVLATTMLAGWYFLLPDDYESLGKHVGGGAGFISNLLLWSEAGYFDKAAELKPLLHLWSLGIEEQFYLAWPLLLWAAWAARWRVAMVVGGVLLASFAMNFWLTPRDPVAAFYFPLTRFWELACGALLASIEHRSSKGAVGAHSARLHLLSWMGAALVLGSALWLDPSMPFPGWRAALPVLGAAMLIGAGATAPFNRWVLSRKPMVWIGLVSYPLYLWHWPILAFQNIVSVGPPPTSWRWVALTAAFLLAAATFHGLERPLRFGQRMRARAAGLAGAMVAVASVGIVLHAMDGIPSRLPGPAIRYANYTYDFRTDARAGTCWLGRQDSPDAFAPDCVDSTGGHRPLLVVWGDSHAARLFPGIRAVAGDDYRLAQFTRDSCAPVLPEAWRNKSSYPNCWKGNGHVMSRIRELAPDTVLLFARWSAGWTQEKFDRALVPTIVELTRSGVRNVIVVGPAPEWHKPLPSTLIDLHLEDSTQTPKWTSRGLSARAGEVDPVLRDVVAGTGATYFAPRSVLCNENGCQTYVGSDPDRLTSWDYGHLTTSAAILVARAMAAETRNFSPAASGPTDSAAAAP